MKNHILKIIFLLIILVSIVTVAKIAGQKEENSRPPAGKAVFIGTIKTGASLGEIKSYCPEGFYLVADEGTYLVGQTPMLQLRLADETDGTKMFSDQKYVGKKVKIAGKYPAQEAFCEALLCQCDDYLLVEDINFAE